MKKDEETLGCQTSAGWPSARGPVDEGEIHAAVDELEAKVRTLEASQRLACLGTVEVDPLTGRWTGSDVFEEILGIGESVARTVDGIAPFLHPSDRGELLRRLRTGGNDRWETECRCFRGCSSEERWTRWCGDSLQVHSGARVVCSVQDVTEFKLLGAEYRDLLRDATFARTEAEAANRAKDMFLATLSHDLRAPLSTVMLRSALLRRRHPELREDLGVIERAVQAQAQLIDDLLDVSRISAGKLALKKSSVKLAGIIREAIESVRESVERKNINLEVELDGDLGPVFGDPVRLQQLVWNLLSNALKFTPENGRIRVTLDGSPMGARIRVSDTGSGIEPAFLPRLFNHFTQEDASTTRRHSGLGLGLAIVRGLVDAHGGTIHAASDGKNRGATFVVVLPFQDPSVREIPGLDPFLQLDCKRGLSGARILVVEDDSEARKGLTSILDLSHADVRAVGSAKEAIEAIDEFCPDLVICDIAMPDEDGYSLMRRIRARSPDRCGRVPALALTACVSEDDRALALASGFQAHLPKPMDMDRFMAKVTELLPRFATDNDTLG